METAPKSMPSPLRSSGSWAALDGLDRAPISWEKAMSPPSDPLATNARLKLTLTVMLHSGDFGKFAINSICPTAQEITGNKRKKKGPDVGRRWAVWGGAGDGGGPPSTFPASYSVGGGVPVAVEENPRDLTAGLRLGQSIKTMESRATAAMARRTAVYCVAAVGKWCKALGLMSGGEGTILLRFY
ncbi:8-amino-7-oxononanoate synthase [Striga asiatica]|uniref:8-amino-7-oxononanoate synthase n=1 Tax=Striga asiatica TaxID=4170 RepID=A0A5A7Q9Z1_STRAF|nr:8-amino-7-oxononanoate synthase [Striga asiatica]